MWLIVPVLVLLVGLPGVFSTPNDKRKVVIATPGPVRVGIEMLIYSVAFACPLLVWAPVASGLCAAIVVASLVLGMPRILWLLRGAPPEG